MTLQSRLQRVTIRLKRLSRKAVTVKHSLRRVKSKVTYPNTTEPTQPFPFLALPAELRLAIYDFWLEGEDVNCRAKACTKCSPLVIGHINRQIRHEALPHLFLKKTFVTSAPLLEAFIYGMPDGIRPLINSLRLEEFPNFTMHYLLGNNHIKQPILPLSTGQALTEVLPALKRLSIRISKNIDKPPQPSQDILDRFLADVKAEDLLKQESLTWLMKCNGLSHFLIMRKKPGKKDLERLEGQPFGFLRTLVTALDGVEESVKIAVTGGVQSDGSTQRARDLGSGEPALSSRAMSI